MPFLSSFGTNSARNYGQRARQPVLTQLTYTSNATFTVPSGVTSVSISGRGASGTFQPQIDGYAGAAFSGGSFSPGTTRTTTDSTWVKTGYIFDEPYRSQAFINTTDTGNTVGEIYATSQGFGASRIGTGPARLASHGISSSDGRWNTSFSGSPADYESVADGYIAEFNGGSKPRTVGPTSYTLIYVRIAYGGQAEVTTTGSNATGFGNTFPGGVGGTATTFDYTQAVSFGQSYNLVIPGSSSFITVSYYV